MALSHFGEPESTRQHALDEFNQLPGVIGLGQELVRFVGRLVEDLRADRPAQQKDLLLGFKAPAPMNQVHAVHAVHGVIGDQQVRLRLGRGVTSERELGISERFDVVTLRFKDRRGQFKEHRLIIDNIDQNTGILTRFPG